MTADGKKYKESPEGTNPGLSEAPQAKFSGVEVHDEDSGGETPRSQGLKQSQNDGFEGFVPNIPATATFTAEEAQSRKGNYVLSLGLGGSGKSTLHSFLLRYIEQSGKVEYEMSIPRLKNGEEDFQTRNLLNQWRSSWNKGEFVASTAATEAAIREIKYRVVPSKGVRAPLDFGMIEVSGELLKQVQGGRTGKQSLPEAIHHLIANRHVNLILLMMVHPDTPNNDILLANFIDYIDQKFPGRRHQITLGVIIANPDRALEQLKKNTGGLEDSPFSHYSRLEDEAVVDYMSTMAPGIWAKWNSWPEKQRMITPLRLGDTRHVQQSDGEDVSKLVSPDYTHIEKIFNWLFFKFTGKRPGPTFWQRLVRDLSKPT